MEFKDYYKVLGVERTASDEALKKAYRRLARKHHPDVSKAADAQSRMQEINEAYEVLRDRERRLAYDQVGQDWASGQTFTPPPGWDSGYEFSGGPKDVQEPFGHSDFFEALFGAAQRTGRAGGRGSRAAAGAGRGVGDSSGMRGEDHQAKIIVPLEDAFAGAQRELLLHHPSTDGGTVRLVERRLQVSIPRGIRAGQRIRLAGQGSPGLGGGPAGDLYLEVEFAPHPQYRVEGRDLQVDLRVAPWEAALGTRLRVDTPGGAVELAIPAGSQSGRRLRLRGRGIPAGGTSGEAGDLYVQLQLVLPPADSEAARSFYRKMKDDFAFDPRATV